ncbi:histidine kinase [Streptomyces sp. PLAI1-29]|uniref:Histidine kinase n=2 Tax=Streptomyces zingiberis TaxID=2053010 RepID=A0ABX1C6P7_9ACTN|nr:histidine kinase [Streptomyces zingiberis]
MVWLVPLYTLLVLTPVAARDSTWPTAALLLLLTATAQAVSGVRLLGRGLDQYRGQGTVSRGELTAGAVLMLLSLLAVGALLVDGTVSLGDGPVATMAVLAILPFLGPCSLLGRLRTMAAVQAACVLTVAAGFLVAGVERPVVLVVTIALAFALLWSAFTVRCSAWVLAVMWELEETRTVQARLAVAEERLRFSRDLHDVMGRNLAVIALKSELAVRLARRGAETAVDQMVEVQRIAVESQREVRDVVRGYREADLHTELVGAGAVLRAAGIGCRIEDRSPDGLPAEVRAALGWVVREGATNVLRHAEARHCTIRVRPGSGPGGIRTAVLVMENDGVTGAGVSGTDGAGGPAGPARRGSGLDGLRQRLAEAGGTVTAGPVPGGGFRLTAQMPAEPVPEVPEGPGAAAGTPRAGDRADPPRPGPEQPHDGVPATGPGLSGAEGTR